MASEDEIKFAKARFKLQDAICTCFTTAELLLPLEFVEGGGRVDSVVGNIQPDTLSGQQLIQYRSYRSNKTKNPVKIEIAIGHTGPNWTPIVTVTSSSSEPEQVLFNGEFGNDLSKMLQIITKNLSRIL